MNYTPHFAERQQTPAQRWNSVSAAIAAGGYEGRVPSQETGNLLLRYVAGELDLDQVRDELLRGYTPHQAAAADVRPVPPELPGRGYPYAAELTALLRELAPLPPPPDYINVTDMVPQLDEITSAEAARRLSLAGETPGQVVQRP